MTTTKASREELKRREEEFQKALKDYRETNSIDAYETIFLRVRDCCQNIILKKLQGCHSHIDDERILNYVDDATLMVMENIVSKDVNPEKLSSYCYFRCLAAMLDKQKQFDETKFSRFADYSEEFEEQVEKENYIEEEFDI